jgi:hypothetical protein
MFRAHFARRLRAKKTPEAGAGFGRVSVRSGSQRIASARANGPVKKYAKKDWSCIEGEMYRPRADL